MKREILVRNPQRTRCVNGRFLRKIVEAVLGNFPEVKEFELGIHIVGAREMAKVNEQFLSHEGATDVITFDHTDPRLGAKKELHGEIFVCINEAISQSKQFRTSWQSELVRYVVHGLLHLMGFDDKRAMARKKMKREEDRLHRQVEAAFGFRDIETRRRRVQRS